MTPEVWLLAPERFPSGVTSVFRVFLTGLSTPRFRRFFLVFRLSPPPQPRTPFLALPFFCVVPPRPASPEFRSQFGSGAGPSHSAGPHLLRLGPSPPGLGAPGWAVRAGPPWPLPRDTWEGVSGQDAPCRPRSGAGRGELFLKLSCLFCGGGSGNSF